MKKFGKLHLIELGCEKSREMCKKNLGFQINNHSSRHSFIHSLFLPVTAARGSESNFHWQHQLHIY